MWQSHYLHKSRYCHIVPLLNILIKVYADSLLFFIQYQNHIWLITLSILRKHKCLHYIWIQWNRSFRVQHKDSDFWGLLSRDCVDRDTISQYLYMWRCRFKYTVLFNPKTWWKHVILQVVFVDWITIVLHLITLQRIP